MEFRILGPLEVRDRGLLLPLGGAKQRALLAILLINANKVVAVDRLIDLLWDEEPPETANNVLQVYVSQFRKLLEPQHPRGTPYQVLVSQPPGYLLKLGPGQLDAVQFEKLLEKGRGAMARRDPLTAATTLRNALGLWRGTALADVAGEPFAVAEVARLTDLRLHALEERIDADLAMGGHADTVGELQALVAEHPLRERLCGQLMLALYRSGRQAEASDVYQRIQEALVDQLGMAPGPKLQQLLRKILNQDPALEVEPKALDAERSNLPAKLTSFIGRERDLSEIKDLLARSRLVTLTGSGGIGKTRLAIELCGRLLDDYRDGVWLVDLAPVADPDLVVKTVMYALGLRVQGGGVDVEILTAYLKGRRQVLLLDNCEHVIEPVARLTASVLRECPDIRILATSREPLGVSGEVNRRVPSLSTPDPGRHLPCQVLLEFESVSLFCECATRAVGTFALTDANAIGVARICHRLDGIPLAIELAASRLKLLSVDELGERLSDSLGVLRGGSRTAGARHQTLQATMAWSYRLLDASEQALFGRLSVFAGGFTVSAAEAVCAPAPTGASVLDLLAHLVDKSLVLPADVVHGRSRLRILEVLRQFGHERLMESGEATTIQDGHADHFTSWAEDWSPKLRGPEQGLALDRFEVEHDNLRAALAWSQANGREDLALRLVAALWLFWYVRGYGAEGLRVATDVLARFDKSHPSRGEALCGAAKLAWQQRDLHTAERLAGEALALFDKLHDPGGRGLALLDLANNSYFEGKVVDAETKYAEALRLLRAAGNEWGASIALNNLGNMVGGSGRYAEAERYLGDSLECGIRIGDPWRKLMALGSLGELYAERDKPGRAADIMVQCFVIQRDTHNIFSLPYDLDTCARLAVAFKQPERALRLAGAADGIRRRFGSVSRAESVMQNELDLFQVPLPKTLEEARGAIEANVADAAWQEGLAMSADGAIDYALAWLPDLTASNPESVELAGFET